MELEDAVIVEHEPVTSDYRRLVLEAPAMAREAVPGQFVHLRIPTIESSALRRPLSICDAQAGRLVLLYKQVGRGTRALARMNVGEKVNLLGPLGRGFPLPEAGSVPLLVGGGFGVAPLLFLAKRTAEPGVLFVGGRTADDVLLVHEFEALGWTVHVCTNDGSWGQTGFVTTALDAWVAAHTGVSGVLYCCGPDPLLQAVDARAQQWQMSGWLSLDHRMACGTGACLGCVQKIRHTTTAGETMIVTARVCKDGPVFAAGTIEWEVAR